MLAQENETLSVRRFIPPRNLSVSVCECECMSRRADVILMGPHNKMYIRIWACRERPVCISCFFDRLTHTLRVSACEFALSLICFFHCALIIKNIYTFHDNTRFVCLSWIYSTHSRPPGLVGTRLFVNTFRCIEFLITLLFCGARCLLTYYICDNNNRAAVAGN